MRSKTLGVNNDNNAFPTCDFLRLDHPNQAPRELRHTIHNRRILHQRLYLGLGNLDLLLRGSGIGLCEKRAHLLQEVLVKLRELLLLLRLALHFYVSEFLNLILILRILGFQFHKKCRKIINPKF